MKILITGGAGFIGSNYVYKCLDNEDYDEVVCLDSLTYAANFNTLKKALENDKFRFVKGEIQNKDLVEKLFNEGDYDFIVNFAAESHVDNSIKNPMLFTTSNVIGTQNLLEGCRKHGYRYHQVSTDEVYGSLPLDKPELKFTEEYNINPSSPYSASKASADMIVKAYHTTYSMPVTISRCSNNYGPYQFPEKLIPLMIYKATHNQDLPIYGDGLNVRDWLYVEDHCDAIECILRRGKLGEVYNIGGNNEYSNNNIVKTILDALDKPHDLIKYVKDRPGHDRRYAIDSSKIQSELGWRPQHTFETGIKDTIKWYLNNMDWLQEIMDGSYVNNYKE